MPSAPYSFWLNSNGPRASDDVRNRGEDYFAQNRVTIDTETERSVLATVQGAEAYHHVGLRFTRMQGVLEVGCTCPFYSGGLQFCKHIWATLRMCESQSLMQGFIPQTNTGIELLEPEEIENARHKNGLISRPIVAVDAKPVAPPVAGWFTPLGKAKARTRAADDPAWKKQLQNIVAQSLPHYYDAWPVERQIVYVVDVEAVVAGDGLVVEVAYRQPVRNGRWSKLKPGRIPPTAISTLRDPADRQILATLDTTSGVSTRFDSYTRTEETPSFHTIANPLARPLMKLMCQTGRCMLRLKSEEDDQHPIRWDEAGTWEFWIEVHPGPSKQEFKITGSLRRGDERMELDEPALLVGGEGLMFTCDSAAPFDDHGTSGWISVLRRDKKISVPIDQRDALLETLLRQPRLPLLDLCDELRFERVSVAPSPRLRVRAAPQRPMEPERLLGEVEFDYAGVVIPRNDPEPNRYDSQTRRLILRDETAERAAIATLRTFGFREAYGYADGELAMLPKHLPRAVLGLTQAGWHVEAEGSLYRQARAFTVEVRSGVDWFELHGTANFGTQTVGLPELLRALRRGDPMIRLDDGTVGILPEQWLKRYAAIAGLGEAEDDHVRFSRSQAGLLDALLAVMPDASADEIFTKVRQELHSFEGIEAVEPPPSFVGELRPYQREGLGWLLFLQKFGFGGCLADDMGLGKTIQVLALLEMRRMQRKQSKNGLPSLVVVPRSLVFNWKQEASKFTPKLKILDHTGADRTSGSDHFEDFDLVITTYGTLRRDATHFKDAKFDYVILDEAQAVKNIRTESAKAVRLLRGNHRLALSGTPVENHLGELWSLMDFLNPGILGAASAFTEASDGVGTEETRRLLARGLRPFILRRTKQQVASDLPEKLEQTVYCDLPEEQQKLYDQLRVHYRKSLLGRIARDGLGKSKMHVLEALLRLRQAACHPGLIDPAHVGERSAKLDVLLARLGEVVEEDHKALVFSQFTSFLAIVRNRLDAAGIVYEYLDGKTTDRSERVERFQTDPNCKLFLISLKAGGLGLNLTAADYVFLLDPWWNPAVEAQAIDRSHRIGQTRQVFACRLIAKGTVEEKVLELQQSKRDLADAIITADNSIIRTLDRTDLELLLS